MPKQAQPLIPLLCTQCSAPIRLPKATLKKVFKFDDDDNTVVISIDADQPIVCPNCGVEFVKGDAFPAPANIASLELEGVGTLVINGSDNIIGNGNIKIGNISSSGGTVSISNGNISIHQTRRW
jgi:DNA-directed RNA polymerase subunit RPC12/RpoP